MSYYVKGYEPPEFVRNAEDVEYYQRALGVKVDGIWGRKTQAAYDRWLNNKNTNNNTESKYSGYSWPKELPRTNEDWENVSRLLQEYLEGVMRPVVDTAVAARKKAASTDMAETDADAASRGMLGSSFVSSLKTREQTAAQADITAMESEYAQALASQIYEALSGLQKQVLEERRYQYQAALDREKLDLEREKMYLQYNDSGSSSGYRSSGSRSGNSSAGNSGYDNKTDIAAANLNYEQCYNMLEYLGDEAEDFFNSPNRYWRTVREEVKNALSEEEYEALKYAFLKRRSTPHNKYSNREMIQ